jgi:hypothetical protein
MILSVNEFSQRYKDGSYDSEKHYTILRNSYKIHTSPNAGSY